MPPMRHDMFVLHRAAAAQLIMQYPCVDRGTCANRMEDVGTSVVFCDIQRESMTRCLVISAALL